MTLLERIKKAGGFLDCGAVGSMPLGYFMDGTVANRNEYWEIQKLIAAKKIIVRGKATNEDFIKYLSPLTKEGDLYQVK